MKCYQKYGFRWEEVEKESGLQLVYKTGGVNFAKTEQMGHLIDKYAEVMETNGFRYVLYNEHLICSPITWKRNF